MRTTATYTVSTPAPIARQLVQEFLVGEGLEPRTDPDWDGSVLWGSCALRFGVCDERQGYWVEVHIRDLSEPGVPRCSVELRQDACGYRGDAVGPRRPAVVVAHLDDRLRLQLDRRGVVERVEQFA